jgi:hypothetical protein
VITRDDVLAFAVLAAIIVVAVALPYILLPGLHQ